MSTTKTINDVVVEVLSLFGELESQDDRRTVLAMVAARYGLSHGQDSSRRKPPPSKGGKQSSSGGLDYYSNPPDYDSISHKGKGKGKGRGGKGSPKSNSSEWDYHDNPTYGNRWSSSGEVGNTLVHATNHFKTTKESIQFLSPVLPKVFRTTGSALPNQSQKPIQKRFTKRRVELGKAVQWFNKSVTNSSTFQLINSIQSFRIVIRDFVTFHLKSGTDPLLRINPFLGIDLEVAKAEISKLLAILKEDGDLAENGFCLDSNHKYGVDAVAIPEGVVINVETIIDDF